MKRRFTFKLEEEDRLISHSSESLILSEVLEDVEFFLKGCGYIFDGNIGIELAEGEELEEDVEFINATEALELTDEYTKEPPFTTLSQCAACIKNHASLGFSSCELVIDKSLKETLISKLANLGYMQFVTSENQNFFHVELTW